MQMVQKESADRLVFFDNIRYLMVLLVVVLHAGCGYSNYLPYWAVDDENSNFFDHLLIILGVFLMPTLFFIAGYFTLPSLEQKGTWVFIKSKLKRLGIPWLLGVALLGPIIKYIYFYSRGNPVSYLSLWSYFVKNIEGALSFDTGFIASPLQFHHMYFWFISLLLFFFIVFALLCDAKKRWLPFLFSSRKPTATSMKSILLVFLLVGVLNALIAFYIYGIFHGSPNRDPWIIFISLIQFQAVRIVLYISCFGAVIYAFSNSWFKNGEVPGHFILWTLLSIGLMYIQGKALAILMGNFSIGLAFGWVLVRTLLVFTILLALISFGIQHWNTPSRVNRHLAANSYNIYLLHMIFVVVFQLVLLQWFGISIFIKFGIVTLLTILLSYLISQYAIRPFPKLSVAGMIALFVLLTPVLSPTVN
jgi:glucan biosynthesis protein C